MGLAANALERIIERKRREVEEAKALVPIEAMRKRALEADPPRNFFRAVTTHPTPDHWSVIAEIKRKSPSAGWIREEYRSEDFDPVDVARAYHEAGAVAISCLTDEVDFGGHIDYVRRIRNRVPLPVLRKDFIVDPWQVYEARAASADAILLIADVLTMGTLLDLLILATELRMTTLVEVHEVERLLLLRPHIGFPHPGYMLLGINNRDLRTMTTDLNHTLRLAEMVEDHSVLVSESGIRTHADLIRLREGTTKGAHRTYRMPHPQAESEENPSGHSSTESPGAASEAVDANAGAFASASEVPVDDGQGEVDPRSEMEGGGWARPRRRLGKVVPAAGAGRHATTAGIRAVLVGEHLMRHPHPGEALRDLLRPGG